MDAVYDNKAFLEKKSEESKDEPLHCTSVDFAAPQAASEGEMRGNSTMTANAEVPLEPNGRKAGETVADACFGPEKNTDGHVSDKVVA